MTYPTTQAPPPAKPKGMLIAGIVLVVVSIVAFVGPTVWATTSIASTTDDAPAFEAPGTLTTTLEAGDHAIWTNSAYIGPGDVTITGPGGEVTSTDAVGGDATASLSRDGTSFSPEVTFVAPTTGSYTVTFPESSPSTDVVVGPPASAFSTAFATIAIAFLAGSLIGLIGVIVLIVGLVRRSRAKRQQGPPPGAFGAPGPYGQPTYGQPAYGQPAYGQPANTAPPGSFGAPPGSIPPPGPPGMGPPPRP